MNWNLTKKYEVKKVKDCWLLKFNLENDEKIELLIKKNKFRHAIEKELEKRKHYKFPKNELNETAAIWALGEEIFINDKGGYYARLSDGYVGRGRRGLGEAWKSYCMIFPK